jgi:hypothetical protein
MRTRQAWPLLLFLPLSWRCAVEEIVFVTTDAVPASVDAGATLDTLDTLASVCSRSEDCAAGEYCALPDCEATLGTCRRPAVCDATFAPVCGCNAVTYFNDCLREVSGVGAATPGVCQSTAHCGAAGDTPCPDGGYCARLFPFALRDGACLQDLPGSCWVIPFACGREVGALRWRSCMGGSFEPCADICSAIRSEVPHSGALSCRP